MDTLCRMNMTPKLIVTQSGSRLNPVIRLVDPRQYVYVIPADKCHGVAPAVIVRERK